MIFKKDISIKYKFWFHYISIALFACTMVGLVFYSSTVTKLQNSIYDNAAAEMSSASAFLENQLGVLKDISTLISSNSIYKRSVRDSSEASRRNVIYGLKTYLNFTPLADTYFLYYRNEAQIWKPGSMSSLSTYSSLVLKENSSEALLHYLDNLDAISCYPVSDQEILLSIPIHIDNYYKDIHDASVTFVIEISTLKKQLAVYMPGLYPYVNIFLQDHPFFTSFSSDTEEAFEYNQNGYFQNKNYIKVFSAQKTFCIVIDKADIPSLSLMSDMNAVNSMMFLLIIALICALSYALATWTYKPIRQLIKRHNMGDSLKLQNEITMLDSLLARTSVSESTLKEQTQKIQSMKEVLCNQFLLRLISGQPVGNPEKRAKELGLYFPGTYYMALRIRWSNAGDKKRVLSSVTELTDSSWIFLAVDYDAETECIVIINLISEDCSEMACSLLKELGKSGEVLFEIVDCSDICETISSLSFAIPVHQVQETYNKMHAAFEQSDFNAISSIWVHFLGEICYLSAMQRKFVTNELFMKLTGDIDNIGSLRSEMIHVLAIEREDERNEELGRFLSKLGNAFMQNQTEAKNDLARILQYIDIHLSDPDLDIYMISNALSLSQKSIRDMLKAQTGLSVREYLNQRRVNAAKEKLLTTDSSVAEIALNVGYGSVSYFIKGNTAQNFRAIHQ